MARRSGHAKKIDTVHWTLGTFGALALASGASAAVTVGPAQHLPETLMRIRGEWAAAFDGFQSPGVHSRVTAGMVLVPEGTGTTVLWSPETDGDAPWIWWDVFNLLYEEAVQDVVGSQQSLSRHRVIDSKAMRKIRNTELQMVVENVAVAGTPAVNMGGSVRVLAGS